MPFPHPNNALSRTLWTNEYSRPRAPNPQAINPEFVLHYNGLVRWCFTDEDPESLAIVLIPRFQPQCGVLPLLCKLSPCSK